MKEPPRTQVHMVRCQLIADCSRLVPMYLYQVNIRYHDFVFK
jgi:hypothetical protein